MSAIQIVVLIFLMSGTGNADTRPSEDAAKLLPDRIGSFKATGEVRSFPDRDMSFNDTSSGVRDYQSAKGQQLSVFLYKNLTDSGAYARFNVSRPLSDDASLGLSECKPANIGTLGCSNPKAVYFYKGPVCVVINSPEPTENSQVMLDFARQFAETLDKGEGEIPALVKHLPGWQSGNLPSSYAVSLRGLKTNVPDQPVFDAISFEGGVEAVSANYGASKLVIVEFNTPQLATDNTARIVAKIQELRDQGQPIPTGYRRVGNYAVFVFDAPTPEAANQLIDQVKYQQVVQWLGENPFSHEQATREFTETTLGVLVSVVKASGLALVGCLAVGGLFGALLFARRRAQQRAVEAYVDGGAMLRLNIDELTPERDPGRLLGNGH